MVFLSHPKSPSQLNRKLLGKTVSKEKLTPSKETGTPESPPSSLAGWSQRPPGLCKVTKGSRGQPWERHARGALAHRDTGRVIVYTSLYLYIRYRHGEVGRGTGSPRAPPPLGITHTQKQQGRYTWQL